MFVHSVPGEARNGEKGKLMVAFTDHKDTCTAVNTLMVVRPCENPLSHPLFLHRGREDYVAECPRVHCAKKECNSYFIHMPFCVISSLKALVLNWRAILHVGVFSVLVHQSRNKDLQLFCALHEACGTGTHTKQQHVIKNWIPSPAFKIFMQVACTELK